MTFLEALSIAGVGLGVVLLELGLLAAFIVALSWVVRGMTRKRGEAAANAAAPADFTRFIPAPPAAPAQTLAAENRRELPDNESRGSCELIRTDDQTAAMIMAIVADDLQTPLNRLYFKSIRLLDDAQTRM